MSLDPADLAKTMLAAGKKSLGAKWSKVQDYAEGEFKRLAQSLAETAQLAAEGKITAAEAASLVRIHQHTGTTIMLTVEGMGIIAVEGAINAALDAVRDVVNRAAGIKIL